MIHVLAIFVLVFSLLLIGFLIAVFWTSFLRRKDTLPPDMFDGDLPTGTVYAGTYIATYREGGKRPFRAGGFLLGGSGEFYLDEKGVSFLVEGTRQPVHFPFSRILGASVDAPRGKIGERKGDLVITWNLEGRRYCSSFAFEDADSSDLRSRIEKLIEERGDVPSALGG